MLVKTSAKLLAKYHYLGLYVSIGAGSVLLAIIALGPGLIESHAPHAGSWQHAAFSGLCHQLSERSFTFNGSQMAVCSRCFGIYAFFPAAWLALPLLAGRISGRFTGYLEKFLFVGILINFVDVTGNFSGLWTNTHWSRFGLGAVFSISLALYFVAYFSPKSKSTSTKHIS